MVDDEQTAWLAKLDWSAHGPAKANILPSFPMEFEPQPLANVLRNLAERSTEPWPTGVSHFLSRAGNRPIRDWVFADEAFDDQGRPIHSFHESHSAEVRALAREFTVGIAAKDVITKNEWSAVEDAIDDYWEIGRGARRVWWTLGPVFARLAAEKAVMVLARPTGGGDPVPFDPTFWLRADPDVVFRRLADCTVPFDAPFDVTAKRTHQLFVSKPGLDRALNAAARETYMSPISEDVRIWREIDQARPGHGLLLRHLKTMLTEENADWITNDLIRSALQIRLCCQDISARKVADLRREVLDGNPRLRDAYSRSGPRKKQDKPLAKLTS